MEWRRTMCNRDCPDSCGIEAQVVDERVIKLRGDRQHPVTGPFLCYRTNQFLRRQYAPDRITQPLLRQGGELRPVSWDQALSHIADKLGCIIDESGPAAIFHYRSGGSLGMLVGQSSDYFFEQLGPVTIKRGDICSGAGDAAQTLDFGVSDSNQLDDLLKARNIIVWGKNVHTSSPHTLPTLKKAREQGALLTLIDPVHHQGTQLAQRYLQPRPAGDFALAMAIARILFERDWTASDAASYCDNFEAFKQLCHQHTSEQWCQQADVTLAEATFIAKQLHEGPTSILIGWGMARRTIGGAIVRAIDAIAAISGNVGRSGACPSYYFQRRSAFRKITQGKSARTICEPMFGPEVLAASDPPIRAIWVTAGNPVAMLPQSHTVAEALSKTELVVLTDCWLSDTAELADVVLPIPTLLEADDILGAYGNHTIGAARPVVEPPPMVKSDLQIFQALAPRMGLGDVMAGSARDWKRRLMRDELSDHGVSLETLDNGAVANPLAKDVVFEGRQFQTANKRVQLIDAAPTNPPQRASADYPLVLMSLSSPKSQSSQWAKEAPRPTTVTVHPQAAGGIADGALARLESVIGHMQVRVKHDLKQRCDVVLIPKGGHLRDGSCANVLVRATVTDLGEGGALYDEGVRLRPLED